MAGSQEPRGKKFDLFWRFETSIGHSSPGACARNQPSSSEQTTAAQMTLTPSRRAALKLQGQYMGYMRGLKPRQKSKVKKVREAKGIPAAIAVAKRWAA
jgi:hypothetical protein